MELTVEQALQKGIEAHRAGKVQEADQYYTAILKANPKHPEANHNMGVLGVGFGKVEQAIPFFKNAVEANSNIAQYWLSYIDALIKLGRIADGKAVFNQAMSAGARGEVFDQIEKRLHSDDSDGSKSEEPSEQQLQSLINLHIQSQYQVALNKGSHLLEQFPNSINLYNIIGAAYQGLGKLEEAIDAYGRAISIEPDYAEAHKNRGNALQEQRKLEEAIDAYNKAISIEPDYAEAYNNMGVSLKDCGNLDEAINAYKKAISIEPNFAEAHYNIGNALHEQRKLDEALGAYSKTISIEPDYAEAYNNMGNVLKDQGKLDEAIETYHKALTIEPDFAEVYNSMGIALKYQGKLDEAINAYNKAILIKPDFADAHKNMGFAKLQTAEWKHGIKLRAWRWKTSRARAYERFFNAPEWDGEASLHGKTLLIWGEQGPGDIIIWCSTLSYYKSIYKNLIIECSQKLVKLLTISFPKITVRAENKDIEQGKEDFDYQIPIETLFGYACLSGKISGHQNQYIFPDKTRVEYWRNRLKLITEKPCIGISWKSPVMNLARQNNYADLSFWKPLLQNEKYTFFNLQSSHFSGDLQRIYKDFGVEVINFDDLDHYDDLAEVAAFCKALDKSICVATTVAHISTAVGTETIIPTWKQGPWNNILFNSRGPKITLVYRNTWDPWDIVFDNIAGQLS